MLRARREGDEMVLTTYGRSSGFCIDPIEKKPLNHFLPGTPVLSFGTAGCNLACKFCQNWDISKARDSIAFETWPRPRRLRGGRAERLPKRRLHLQRSRDLPRIRDRHGEGLPRAGNQEGGGDRRLYLAGTAERVLRHMDAANVDLKGFTEEFYKKLCAGSSIRCSTRSSTSSTRRRSGSRSRPC